MTTVATPALKLLAAEWEKLFGSAKTSGIIGDARHKAAGGYHLSRQDNPAGNYSIVRPDDKYGPADAASAVDMTMNTADMKTCTARLVAAYNNLNDPRRKYINAFNGTTDGKTARRWDVYGRKIEGASADHVWHIHVSIRRRYANSTVAMQGILSILKGETVSTYLKASGVSVKVASAGTVSAPPFPGILRRNDSATKPDPNVKLFQAQLRARGWTSQGPSDGYFGAKLESTVKKWQAGLGLGADGVIGPRTWPTPWTRPTAK